MTAEFLFILIIGILILDFIMDQCIDYLNAQHFDDRIPEELADVYDQKEYYRSQAYKKENYRFSVWTSSIMIAVTLAFFFFEGFAWADRLARSWSGNEIVIALLFFGLIMGLSGLFQLPFSYYKTFVIEEKFGFNKSSKALFFVDKVKGWLLGSAIGGILLSLILWFYQQTGDFFWVYTWLLVAVFSLFMTLFYSSLIVPLFNKQKPLEDGELKSAIQGFASKVGFGLDNIYVIDGSKRSTKANAYFSGFGPKKRIVLYDTLIKDLSTEEIVAVLAHEVGHYKRRHVLVNMLISILLTGFTLFIFSLLVGNEVLSEALSVKIPSFHIGLITFGILYSPISELTGIVMNMISRKFEYQADDYAKEKYSSKALISSLKKLSRNSLSNLTPHRANVFVHYSHPPLLARIRNLQK